MKNPLPGKGAALPNANFPSAPSLATPSRTSASWLLDASGPMRTSSSAGLPTRTAFKPSVRSSRTVAACASGTSTRRIAVHFCPAFCVMSRSTSFRKVSYMSPPGPASGPSTAAFRLSASTFTRTDSRMMFGSARIRMPVSPDPVKASTSWAPSSAGRSRGAPTRSESVPSGKTLPSTRISIRRCATIAELVAGLESTGIPARSAEAAFSASPQAGKLNALMCTATPWRGTLTCWP